MNSKKILLAALIGSISVAPVSAMTPESKWEREKANYEKQLEGITKRTVKHPFVLEDKEFKKHLDNATHQAEIGAYENAIIHLNAADTRMQRRIEESKGPLLMPVGTPPREYLQLRTKVVRQKQAAEKEIRDKDLAGIGWAKLLPEKINPLLDEAHQLAQNRQWDQAITKLKEAQSWLPERFKK